MRKPKEIFIKKNKRVVLFFSGGLDSTYLLWKNLELGNTVHPFYVEIKNNDNKSKVEIQQTKFIWSLLKEKYGEQLHPITFGSSVEIFSAFNTESPLKMAQVPMWIFFSLYFQDVNKHDEIHIGYVQDDGPAGSHLDDMKKMYYSFLPLTHGLIDLKFPLRKYSKFNMIEELPKEIFDAIITCENPISKPYKISNAFEYDHMKEEYRFWKPCGECEMCKKIKNSKYFHTERPYNTELDENPYNEMTGGIMLAPEPDIELKK